MKFTPHEYQTRAIEFVLHHDRCLLFLDMGLGKSVITLSCIQRFKDWGEVSKVLVIAPKKVAESTWSTEAQKWDQLDLRVIPLTGTPTQRRKALDTDADVYVIGRDSVVWLTEEFKKSFPFDMVVIDELTSFKNPSSLRFKALKRVLPQVSKVVGLTGTPTPNGLLDLWAQVYCIDGGARLGRFITHYRNKYFDPVMYNNIVIKCPPKPGAEKEIMEAVSDITLAMRASDWLTLPDMIVEEVPVVLSPKTVKQYREFEREQILKVNTGGEVLTADSAASLVNKLAQFANGAIYTEEREVIPLHTEKLIRLQEIFESEDTPLLCFYQYQHDRDRILSAFKGMKGVETRVYKGAQDLEDWNEGKISLLLAHPASTAFGLNMQRGGARIVWFSTGWNLELYDQANARLHRQGQTRPVRVFNLIAQGTVDERMAEALRDKSAKQQSAVKRIARQTIETITNND